MVKNEFESGHECNHDLNDNQNTLIKLKRRYMVVPNTIMCSCKECKKVFKFIKDEKGEGYALVEEFKQDSDK